MKPYRYLYYLPLFTLMTQGAYLHASEIDEVIITSRVEDRLPGETAQPVRRIDKEALKSESGDTLGTLLQNTPGVANASFGQGVGRPMLRGLGGARVKVTMNGVASADVSAMSSDHAAMVDPVNADQVEVIQGPATLFYGGGAIGGIVNVINHRIHSEPVEGFTGTLTSRFSSADMGKQLTGTTDIGLGQWVLHLEGFGRQTADYKPGQNANWNTVSNSDIKGAGGNIALTWVDTDKGFIGFSVSQLNYDYAVPNPNDENARIKPQRTEYELKTESRFSDGPIASWSNELAYSDYHHKELDGDKAEGLFNKDSWHFKSWINHESTLDMDGSLGLDLSYQSLSVCHDHSGCDGIPHWNLPWDGEKGANFKNDTVPNNVNGYDFSHDNPMPLTKTTDYGLFVIEEKPWSQGLISMGARYDYRLITADPVSIRPASRKDRAYYADKTFSLINLNLAGTWALTDTHKLGLALARAQRAPEAEDLYYNGDHHATFSYQLDNPNLDTETAYTAVVNWTYSGNSVQTSLNLYYYAFDGFIYNELQSPLIDPYHGNPVYRHEQRDATFMGGEFELNWQPMPWVPAWSMGLFADYVKAQLTQGSNRNLPRIPPASFGFESTWQKDQWFWKMDVRTFTEQSDVANNETKTPGYSTLNMQARYEKPFGEQVLWVSIKGNNLTNEFGENAVSYLKRYAPIMGRNIIFETGYSF